MNRNQYAALATLILSFGSAMPGVAQPHYSTQDMGTFGGGLASGINDLGQVTGWTYNPGDGDLIPHPFLYSGGSIQNLPISGAHGAFASGINNAGTIVGDIYGYPPPSTSNTRAYTYSQGNLNIQQVPVDQAVSINNSGQFVARVQPSFGVDHAARYVNGAFQDLGSLNGPGGNSSAADINDAGWVVGYSDFGSYRHAFIYNGSTMIDLGTSSSGNYSVGRAINNFGQAVGVLANTNNTRPFLYSNGQLMDLGSLGGSYSQANDINDQGLVIGETTLSDETHHAFVFTGGQLVDLNSLLATHLPTALVDALCINNAGQIVVSGANSHYYLLTPIPEPGTAGLLIVAAAILFLRFSAGKRAGSFSCCLQRFQDLKLEFCGGRVSPR